MFIDVPLGVVIYVIVSWFFGEAFNHWVLVLTIFFAFFPDLDLIPFLLFRKRLRLVSHHIIHFPTVLVSMGSVSLLILTGNAYLVVLFGLCVAAHFVHDSFTSQAGIRWFWPFSKRAYVLRDYRFVRVQNRERFYEHLRTTIDKRSMIDEVMNGIKGELPGIKTWIFFFAAVFLVIFYSFLA